MRNVEQLHTTSSDIPVYLTLAAVTMIWGGTFVAGRFLAGSLSPMFAASLRFLPGQCGVAAAFCGWRGSPWRGRPHGSGCN